MKWCTVYAKYKGLKSFKAIDIHTFEPVSKLMYASMIQNTPQNQSKLNRIAAQNKEKSLIIQLREGTKILFSTK